jgi:hypothetical protein
MKPGEFFMTIDDFKDSFRYYTITYLRSRWHSSYLEKRASVNQRLYKFNFTIEEKHYKPDTTSFVQLEGDGPYIDEGDEETDAEIKDEENLAQEKNQRKRVMMMEKENSKKIDPKWAPDQVLQAEI